MHNKPLFTREFRPYEDFHPEKNCSYVYGLTSEERSSMPNILSAKREDIKFINIVEENDKIIAKGLSGDISLNLRNIASIKELYSCISDTIIYLDITGLNHSIWAPLIKVGLSLGLDIKIIYLEPSDYKRSQTPVLGEIYDLSEKITGIKPLPMFSCLGEEEGERFLFIPLLGFEGPRFAHMYEEVQPSANQTKPIIGVPGFRAEYPFSTYLGNVGPLETSDSQRDIEFVRSNCPFSLFYKLQDISSRFPNVFFKLGLIGTKPHSLGAILFAIVNNEKVEIVYDHVKRKQDRSHGIERCLVYDIANFFNQFKQ